MTTLSTLRIEVINTGTELLLGNVVNTHLAFFGEELFLKGLRIQEQMTIPDGDDIRSALLESAARADLLLVTGGLGPTSDDVTRDVVAALAGLPLEEQPEILEHLREFFARRGYTLRDNVKRQALVPCGATVLHNSWGTAPGLYLQPAEGPLAGKHLFLLPGPPRELRPMFRERVLPMIDVIYQPTEPTEVAVLRMVGLGESEVEGRTAPLLEGLPDLEIGFCARTGEVDLRLIGSPATVARARDIALGEIGEFVFAEGHEDLHEAIIRLLTERGQTVATAESCTGGLLAHRLTNVSGSSAVFLEGFVTYANAAKMRTLGVPEELLEAHGAVSEPVARAMAEGARRVAGSTHALATTGIAGPTGGTEEKPVGTVFVALAGADSPTQVNRYRFPTDRETFKYAVSQRAFDMLRRRILGLPEWGK